MRISEGLNLNPDKYGRVEIPDCSRDDLPEFFREQGFTKGAEIGVRKGRFSEMFCQAGQRVYAVDPWEKYADYLESSPRELAIERQEALDRLDPYDCVILEKTSMEALADIEDGSLDWVYIDANHALPFVIQDIYHWSKKVRAGGVVSGHDYYQFKVRSRWAVKEAVDLYTQVYEIKPWYVLGCRQIVAGERRDTYRSWMWFNG